MIKVIAEHSVDVDLLPSAAMILDLGCRGHKFTEALECGNAHTGRKGYCVDLDEDAKPHYCLAITSWDGRCYHQKTEDPQATYVFQGPYGWKTGLPNIQCMTIPTFSEMVGVKHWDLIKMDIEGSEYKILETAQHPLATQVSVEFHEHTPRGIGKEALDKLLHHLSQFYTIHNQVWEERHGCSANYWDILLIAK